MASRQEIDCFHDSSDGDEEDNVLVDLEWSKLKYSHKKDGYRDGYSAGQEAVLQQAFNQGFAHQVKLETHIAFYKGVLMALKTFSEKTRMSKSKTLRVRLSVDASLRLESLLTELDAISRGTGSGDDGKTSGKTNMAEEFQVDMKDTRVGSATRTTQSRNIPEHFTSLKLQNLESDVCEDNNVGDCGDSSETCSGKCFQSSSEGESINETTATPTGHCKGSHSAEPHGVSEGVGENETSCCKSSQSEKKGDTVSNPTPRACQCLSRKSEIAITKEHTSSCFCQSVNSEGEAAHGRVSVPNRCVEGIPIKSDSPNSKLKTVTRNCQSFLKELGVEDIPSLNQFKNDI